MTRPIQPGDRVAYSARFLRSIACQTGPVPFLRGTVAAICNYGPGVTIATVRWDDPAETPAVNVANLVRVETMGLECVL